MKTRLLSLLAGFLACVGIFADEGVSYVPATMDDVVQGGDFIMASSADLATAYVAKELDVKKKKIQTTTVSSEYGVLHIEVYSKADTPEDNRYRLKMNNVYFGVTSDDNTDLSTEDNKNWAIRLISPGLFRIRNTIRKDGDGQRRLQCTDNHYFSESSVLPGTAGYSGDVYLFKESTGETETHSFSILEAGFTTLYVDHAFQMPAGAVGGIVTEEVEAPNAGTEPSYRLTYDWRYGPGTLVPACTPLVIKGEAGSYPYQVEDSDEAAPAGNLLHGTTDSEGNTCNGLEGLYYYYKLSYKSQTDRTLGFWWGAEDGGPFPCAAGKAYLSILQSHVSRVKGFTLDGTATGIASVSRSVPVCGDVYSLDGRLVRRGVSDHAATSLPAGIYIVDGRKVLVK